MVVKAIEDAEDFSTVGLEELSIMASDVAVNGLQVLVCEVV